METVSKFSTPVELLRAIKEGDGSGGLLEQARSEGGIAVRDADRPMCEVLVAIGIFTRVSASGNYRFAEMMLGPDKSYTGEMINVVSSLRHRLLRDEETLLERANIPEAKIATVRELMKMAVINQLDAKLEPVIPDDKKVLWHILDTELIPYEQRSSFVMKINKFFRDSNLPERIHIVAGDETIESAIASIRLVHPGSVFSVGLASQEAVKKSAVLRKSGDIRMLVFEGKTSNFRQLEGIVAALRTLYLEDSQILPALFHIYRVLGAEPYNGTESPENLLKVLKSNPAEFALKVVCRLPLAEPVPSGDLPHLNRRLREFLIQA